MQHVSRYGDVHGLEIDIGVYQALVRQVRAVGDAHVLDVGTSVT